MIYPNDPPGRVVSAAWAAPEADSLQMMRWRCECGVQTVSHPGMFARCRGCQSAVTVPAVPLGLDRDKPVPAPTLHADAVPPVTTARALAAYRDELVAQGFDPEQVRTFVNIAANDPRALAVDPEFVARAEPVIALNLDGLRHAHVDVVCGSECSEAHTYEASCGAAVPQDAS